MALPEIEKVENFSSPLKITTGQASPPSDRSPTKIELLKRHAKSIEGVTRVILIVS